MGNSGGKFKERNFRENLWRRRKLGERHLREIASVLPRSPSYLGRVALGMNEDQIGHVITQATNHKRDTRESVMNARVGCTAEIEKDEAKHAERLKSKMEDSVMSETEKKFRLLLEWRRRCEQPTAAFLCQNLRRAGYREVAFLYILKRSLAESNDMDRTRSSIDCRHAADAKRKITSQIYEVDAEQSTKPESKNLKTTSPSLSSVDGVTIENTKNIVMSPASVPNSPTTCRSILKKSVAVELATEIPDDMIEVADVGTQTDFDLINGEEIQQHHDISRDAIQENNNTKTNRNGKFVKAISFDSAVSITEFYDSELEENELELDYKNKRTYSSQWETLLTQLF